MSTMRRSPLLTLITIAVVACAMLGDGAQAQAPAPAPTPSGLDCTQYFFNLTNCLSYVMTGSNDTVPDKDCCPELAGLYDSNPICLCDLLAGGAENFGISVDNNRALRLPSVCHIDALPVSLCAELGYPVVITMAPSPSPSGSGPQLPGSTPAPPPQNRAATAFGAANLVALAGLFAIIIGIF